MPGRPIKVMYFSLFFFQAEDGIGDYKVTGVQTCVFFFQAEDGIRDYKVTGVQTCALPIWLPRSDLAPHFFFDAPRVLPHAARVTPACARARLGSRKVPGKRGIGVPRRRSGLVIERAWGSRRLVVAAVQVFVSELQASGLFQAECPEGCGVVRNCDLACQAPEDFRRSAPVPDLQEGPPGQNVLKGYFSRTVRNAIR